MSVSVGVCAIATGEVENRVVEDEEKVRTAEAEDRQGDLGEEKEDEGKGALSRAGLTPVDIVEKVEVGWWAADDVVERIAAATEKLERDRSSIPDEAIVVNMAIN